MYIEEWAQIPHHMVGRLISSMQRRCQAVINDRGHHTRYSTPKANHFLICKTVLFHYVISKILIFIHRTLSATGTYHGTVLMSLFLNKSIPNILYLITSNQSSYLLQIHKSNTL